jgi:hypothetical protein
MLIYWLQTCAHQYRWNIYENINEIVRVIPLWLNVGNDNSHCGQKKNRLSFLEAGTYNVFISSMTKVDFVYESAIL